MYKNVSVIMLKEVFDVIICLSHEVHELRYLKTSRKKASLIQLYFSTQFTIGREVLKCYTR